ncbi:MAG: biotin transporter BioY [bacterium]
MQRGIAVRTALRPLTRSRTVEILFWTLAFTAATALSAQVRIPLPFTSVPLTLQTFFVLLAGVTLGSAWGAASMGLYLALGAIGLPLFTGSGVGLAHLGGPTGGYLLAFPLAAYLAGWIASGRPGTLRILGALAAGEVLVLGAGTLWLSLLAGISPARAAVLGLLPFLAGDAVKLTAAAVLARRTGRLI